MLFHVVCSTESFSHHFCLIALVVAWLLDRQIMIDLSALVMRLWLPVLSTVAFAASYADVEAMRARS